jgi:hypothetical protein
MKGDLEVTLTIPIDENTKFPIKVLTEDKAHEMVSEERAKWLERINAIEADINDLRTNNADKNEIINEVLNIIHKRVGGEA